MTTKNLMRMTRDTVKLGTFSMAGLGAMGAVKGMAPPEAGPVFGAAAAGINLANVGQTANIGLGLSKMLYTERPRRKRR